MGGDASCAHQSSCASGLPVMRVLLVCRLCSRRAKHGEESRFIACAQRGFNTRDITLLSARLNSSIRPQP